MRIMSDETPVSTYYTRNVSTGVHHADTMEEAVQEMEAAEAKGWINLRIVEIAHIVESAEERENRITAQYDENFRDIDSQVGAFATSPMYEPWYLTADERGA
ncbi:hypothetical protein DVR11_22515 [Paracoccus versutus]|nr:hypothetical protein DVR11_22515 [Paracoccus versutus]